MNKLRLVLNEAVIVKGDTKYMSYKGKYYKYDSSGKHEIEEDEYLKVLGKARSKTKKPKEGPSSKPSDKVENETFARDLVVPISERKKAPNSTPETIEDNLNRTHDHTIMQGKRTTIDTTTIKGQGYQNYPRLELGGVDYKYDYYSGKLISVNQTTYEEKEITPEEYERALVEVREKNRAKVKWVSQLDDIDKCRAAVESVFTMQELSPKSSQIKEGMALTTAQLAHYYGAFTSGENEDQWHLSAQAWDSLIGDSPEAMNFRNQINHYTGSGYREIRADKDKSKVLNDLVESVTDVAGYDKGPLFRGVTLTREQIWPMLFEGAEIDMLDAPSSWSTNLATSKQFSDSSDEERIGVLFVECHTPKKGAVSVRALSHFSSERECLYSGNQKWRVMAARSVVDYDEFEDRYQTKIVIEVAESNHPTKVK